MSSKTRKGTTSANNQSKPLGGDGAPDESDPCDIVLDLDLEGVRADGLEGLQKGDRLTLRAEPKGTYSSVVCVRADGMVVGAIASFVKLTALVNCLSKGVRYFALVTEVRLGGCHVYGGRDFS